MRLTRKTEFALIAFKVGPKADDIAVFLQGATPHGVIIGNRLGILNHRDQIPTRSGQNLPGELGFQYFGKLTFLVSSGKLLHA